MEVRFREFDGDADLPGMHNVSMASAIADGLDMVEDFDTFSQGYSSFMESLPSRNVLIAESEGEIIGHARVWWKQISDGTRLYSHMSVIMPNIEPDIRLSMIDWAESRLREIAAMHPPEIMKTLETVCVKNSKLETLIVSMGYEPARYFLEMVRPLAKEEDFVQLPGIDISPVEEERIHEAWAMTRTAFSDHWSYAEDNWSDEWLEEKMQSPIFDRTMWFIASSGNQIVGSVQNYIKPEENKLLSRKRGYISNVCVLQHWRSKGIARALLSRSLEEHLVRGMEQARLAVDSEGPTGALALYQGLGFTVATEYVYYRKNI